MGPRFRPRQTQPGSTIHVVAETPHPDAPSSDAGHSGCVHSPQAPLVPPRCAAPEAATTSLPDAAATSRLVGAGMASVTAAAPVASSSNAPDGTAMTRIAATTIAAIPTARGVRGLNSRAPDEEPLPAGAIELLSLVRGGKAAPLSPRPPPGSPSGFRRVRHFRSASVGGSVIPRTADIGDADGADRPFPSPSPQPPQRKATPPLSASAGSATRLWSPRDATPGNAPAASASPWRVPPASPLPAVAGRSAGRVHGGGAVGSESRAQADRQAREVEWSAWESEPEWESQWESESEWEECVVARVLDGFRARRRSPNTTIAAVRQQPQQQPQQQEQQQQQQRQQQRQQQQQQQRRYEAVGQSQRKQQERGAASSNLLAGHPPCASPAVPPALVRRTAHRIPRIASAPGSLALMVLAAAEGASTTGGGKGAAHVTTVPLGSTSAPLQQRKVTTSPPARAPALLHPSRRASLPPSLSSPGSSPQQPASFPIPRSSSAGTPLAPVALLAPLPRATLSVPAAGAGATGARLAGAVGAGMWHRGCAPRRRAGSLDETGTRRPPHAWTPTTAATASTSAEVASSRLRGGGGSSSGMGEGGKGVRRRAEEGAEQLPATMTQGLRLSAASSDKRLGSQISGGNQTIRGNQFLADLGGNQTALGSNQAFAGNQFAMHTRSRSVDAVGYEAGGGHARIPSATAGLASLAATFPAASIHPSPPMPSPLPADALLPTIAYTQFSASAVAVAVAADVTAGGGVTAAGAQLSNAAVVQRQVKVGKSVTGSGGTTFLATAAAAGTGTMGVAGVVLLAAQKEEGAAWEEVLTVSNQVEAQAAEAGAVVGATVTVTVTAAAVHARPPP
ncbi:unnamed protein product [Closterium sp. Naga37s-1]|nr:unnamed protein product [Closterium sp. Naga37s-1]